MALEEALCLPCSGGMNAVSSPEQGKHKAPSTHPLRPLPLLPPWFSVFKLLKRLFYLLPLHRFVDGGDTLTTTNTHRDKGILASSAAQHNSRQLLCSPIAMVNSSKSLPCVVKLDHLATSKRASLHGKLR